MTFHLAHLLYTCIFKHIKLKLGKYPFHNNELNTFLCSEYCNHNQLKQLSTADFGKVMKQVFPQVRPRRLGTRGNSRYCYAGLKKRLKLEEPDTVESLGDKTIQV